jgi:hypothetical protein
MDVMKRKFSHSEKDQVKWPARLGKAQGRAGKKLGAAY